MSVIYSSWHFYQVSPECENLYLFTINNKALAIYILPFATNLFNYKTSALIDKKENSE